MVSYSTTSQQQDYFTQRCTLVSENHLKNANEEAENFNAEFDKANLLQSYACQVDDIDSLNQELLLKPEDHQLQLKS